nr:MAG TPA: short tail fiber protein [Caudoviricetes sp.]
MKKIGLNISSVDMGGFEGAWLSDGSDGEIIIDIWYWDQMTGKWARKTRNREQAIDTSEIHNKVTYMPFEYSQERGNPKGYIMSMYDYVAHATLGTDSETKPRNIVMNVIIKVK